MAGSIAEWYDFYLYSTATALVFSTEFFKQTGNAWDTIISAFALYGVGFLARPVGALVFGRLGDRRGRAHTLMISLTVVGASTLAIAFLPTFDQVGMLAPILLVTVRLVQGFGFGGEWGGATLIVSENAPSSRRGYWSAWPQVGTPAGNILASLALLVLSRTLSEDQFLTWGWRVAFALSVIVIIIGLWVRSRVQDAPIFQRAQAADEEQHRSAPGIGYVLRHYWRRILIGIGARFAENILYYVAVTFSLTYLNVVVKVEIPNVLVITLMAAGVHFVVMPLMGLASDRFGRRPVFFVGCALTAVWALWAFPLMGTGSPVAMFVAMATAMVINAMVTAPYASLMTEMFPTPVRSTALSFCYQVAPIFAGGFAPLIASALLNVFNSWVPVAVYVGVAALITLVSVMLARETSGVDLEDVDVQNPLCYES
jgi:MFS family permease